MAGNKNSGFASHPENINRDGRPPKEETYSEAIRQEFTPVELATKLRWFIDEKNDLGALKYAYDRAEGKPRETIDQTVRNVPEYVGFVNEGDTEDTDAD